MKKLFFAALLLATAAACVEKAPTVRKTYLYCQIDTLYQSLPAYKVGSNDLFPYSKFHAYGSMDEAAYADGIARIEFEIARPTYVSVMPSRDSTVGMSWSNNFLLLPGDSLEFVSEIDTTFTAIKCVRPKLLEQGRQDNECAAKYDAAFPYKSWPKLTDGDLVKYRSEWEEFDVRRKAFLDSCRTVMTLSEDYYRIATAEMDLQRYNRLCSAVEENPEAVVPAGYLDGFEIPELLRGSMTYVIAQVNKNIAQAVPGSEKNFDAVYAGIRKAPRKQRDYLTALMIGHYAAMQLPTYEVQLKAAIDEAERTIRDTVYLNYIKGASEFYSKRGMPFPEDAQEKTELRAYDSTQKVTLGSLLDKFEGQPVYIDFWASWCCGCIMDMMQSKEAKEFLEESGVVYLYFSIDEDAEAWLKAAKEYNAVENSYLCFDERESPMCKFLEIKSIPRYILLDKEHRIVSTDSPRPVKNSLKELKRLVGSL